MQKAHFAIQACKQPGFMQRGIGLTDQIYGSLGVLFTMVPCLHQCNVYIKRKLRECRAQKCNSCFGAKSPLRSTDCKPPGFMQRRLGSTVQIYRSSGLIFAMVPFLHQCNIYIKRKLRECRAQNCNTCFGAKSPLHSTGL